MKTTFALAALLLSVCCMAQPNGTEWQSPESLSQGKEAPRAYMFSFASIEEAKNVLPYGSTYYRSLDGTWKFHWVPSPEERPADFYKTDYDVSSWDDITVPGCWNVQGLKADGTMKYGVPIYVNQPVIFYHEVKPDDWREGVMRQPKDKRWTTYQYPNEVGSYRRTFTIPKDWKGRHVYVNFDGVDSFFYLWVNGQYVGFSKNSRNTASFDITPYVNRKGDNTLAVEVYRSSDGSFLEAQDMFRLPGIFRSTYLTAMPEQQIRDLAVTTASTDGREAEIRLNAEIRNLGKKEAARTIDYYIYQVALYGDSIERLVGKYPGKDAQDAISLIGIRTWNAETPYRYVLVAALKDAHGKTVDIASTYFGIRTVEIRDTPAAEDEFGLAGRYFYVNGKPVKLKGVNRHETNPSLGHAITREQMLHEAMLMKQGNINHVRLSHYSNDPYWYYLADKYGLYLEDECNIESHQYYYGEASLSHPKEWRAAHVGRNLEMVHAHINHPSIVIWSLGNEAGPGDNFRAAYDAIRQYDTSRPVQYERNNDIVDMGSNQYPSVDWVRQVAKGTAGVKYPFHISEYAHSMGNSLGNLADYWEAMESTNYFCGAAIWDWVDQAIDTYTPDGRRYMGYGGDHGDWPNDGMFCMNGIMLPDLSPKPQYYEVKKVYQNVGVRADWDNNGVRIFNKNYFTTLNDYLIQWRLMRDGREQQSGLFSTSRMAHEPRTEKAYRLPFDIKSLDDGGEYFLNVEFLLTNSMPWAEAGYVQMAEQLPLPTQPTRNAMTASEGRKATFNVEGRYTVVTPDSGSGKDWKVVFNNEDGSIQSLAYGGKTLLADGNGPKLDAFRAPVDNDNWARGAWFANGLYNLRHRTIGESAAPRVFAEGDGCVSIVYTIRSQAPCKGKVQHRPGKAGAPFESIADGAEMKEDDFHFTTMQRYTVFPDGSISVAASIVSSDPSVVLPRLGYAMRLPRNYDRYTYYGRGPLNNYADRKTGSFVGLYAGTVGEQFVAFPKPQSMGNREDVRWCSLQDETGNGAIFIACPGTMSTSALPWSALQMTLAAHPHELPESDGTYLHLDCQVTGLGGNSCGQGGPLQKDRVMGSLHQMKFIIRPVGSGDDLTALSKATCDIPCPVSISRDRSGIVTIHCDKDMPSRICYVTGEGKSASPVTVCNPADGEPCSFNLRGGGIVTAWYESEPSVKTTARFDRIESVPVEVVYVSSEEGPAGEVAKNLVDGDPSTIWHTMYSITVGTYPHWIDLDCNEMRNIKGFCYMPRQDGGSNGNIKEYKIELSQDGKTWSDPVCKGTFENNLKEKRVMFDKPHKARFLRFTALSSQNGSEFASGAEFSVIAE